MLIPHTLDDVADGPGLGVVLRTRAATASQPSLFHVSGIAGIADAKKKARAKLSGGTEGSWVTGLDTHVHSGTPHQHPHLRSE